MPRFLNTNQPMSYEELQNLYAGSPNQTPQEVESSMLLNAPQGQEYVRQAANRFGIQDAASYFSQQQTAARMAQMAATSGVQQPQTYASDAQRIAAQFPQTDPVVTLQNQRAQALQRYVLPTNEQTSGLTGMTPSEQYYAAQKKAPTVQVNPQNFLSPTAQQDATQQGLTPYAYQMKQRLGDLATFQDPTGASRSWVNPQAQSAYAPEQLYNIPEFRAFHAAKPKEAQHVFQALTGQALDQYEGVRTATLAQHVKEQEQTKDRHAKSFYDAATSGDLQWDPNSEQWIKRDFTYDKITGKQIPSEKFSPVTGIWKEIVDQASKASPEYARAIQLEAKKKAEVTAANVATTAQSTRDLASKRIPTNVAPNYAAQPAYESGGYNPVTAGGIQGIGQDIKNLLSGQALTGFGGQAYQFPEPTGAAPTKLRGSQMLQSDYFQKLLKENPTRAMTIIASLQNR